MGAATADPPAAERQRIEEENERQREQAAAMNGGTAGDGEFPGEGEPQGEQEPEEAPPAIPPLELQGEGEQLTLSVGGAKPTVAEVKLRGGSIEVPGGQFAKGSVVDLVIKARVCEVHLVDKMDNQTGEVTSTTRRHVMKLESVERV